MLYLFSAIFAILTIIAWYIQRPFLQPIVFAIYGIVSLILAVYQSSSWTPIFVVRYFLMIISSLIIVAMPIFILLIMLLLIYNLLQKKQQTVWNRLINMAMIISLTLFLVYTVWGLINIRTIDFTSFYSLYSTLALYFTTLFISYYLIIFVIHLWPAKNPSNLLIILGSDVGESGEILETLKRRLDTGCDYYNKYSRLSTEPITFIVTGGKATKYRLSEADYMAQYLIANGIPTEQIIIESQAENTDENFSFIKEIIESMDPKPQISIITSKFHLIRANFFAWRQSVRANYIGSSSPLYLWPYAIIREYIAFVILTKEINFVFLVYLIISILQIF
ncbi:YdcF family protein [Fundicoccus culcitae]|uniref:YdcF family protein n=1 Tax=Fundicoccus culcitae TaxID=2969821 RepID=A0ABY5P3Y6_9LACT|nr:YdcF family protein [Fundicoccus culcitae]UUX33148.1 YdcF family protein [Fundicoccus culcitae]